MAIQLVATYSKRLGLPGFSSHQFEMSITSELSNTDHLATASALLYEMLQTSVDQQLQQKGFIPPPDYGGKAENQPQQATASEPCRNQPAASASPIQKSSTEDQWKCSDKQKQCILKLGKKQHINIDSISTKLFGKQSNMLSKMEASGLISHILGQQEYNVPVYSPQNYA